MTTSNTPAPVVRPAPVRAAEDRVFAAYVDSLIAAHDMAAMMTAMVGAYQAGVEAQRMAQAAAAVTTDSARATRHAAYSAALVTPPVRPSAEETRNARAKAEAARWGMLRGAA